MLTPLRQKNDVSTVDKNIHFSDLLNDQLVQTGSQEI